ncbi:energy transducer TonB [Sphingobacterium ginsenosidimutans]|uniref:energy transducer TonB n=1 Tax=Sphingobacterium ginsenosidimutans TaxID=687845 RepID=UPI0031F858C9
MKYYLHLSVKLICFLLFNLCGLSLSAQIAFTTYHKKDGDETEQKDSAYFLRTVHVDAKGKDKIYRIEEYYLRNDSIKLNGVSKNARNPFQFQGKKYEFYENGTLKSLENFTDEGELVDSAFYLYPNNKLKMMVFYPSELYKKKLQVKKPIYIVYYDSLQNKTLENGNGRIRFNVEGKEEYEEGEIVNNLREGEWKGRAGQDSFVENYNQDRLLSGTLIKEDGAIIQYDSTTYKVNPEYPGGTYKMMTFVANNFDYPKEAMKNGVSGILEIGFVINKVGQVEDIKVKQDLGFGTGEAGIRVVKKLGKWKPGMRRGKPVRVAYTLPIRLNLMR